MDDLRGHNRIKAASILFLFALFLGVMLAVPSLRQAPILEAPVDAPAVAP